MRVVSTGGDVSGTGARSLSIGPLLEAVVRHDSLAEPDMRLLETL